MCQALIIAYGIRHVEFIEEKSLSYWIKEDLKKYRYEWQKTKVGPESLQDSLFHLHPLYEPN
jgi:hypothetical protein